MRFRFFIHISVLLLLAACNGQEAADKNKHTVETEYDKIQLTELDHTAIDLNQYKGKTLFINFWATWCRPCIEEMPSIQKMQEQLNDKNIVYLFASNETVEQIEKFKQKHPYPFHYVRAENMESLNIMALPTTFIINPTGKLVFSEMGYRKWDAKENIDLLINAGK
ncbi:MAG: TlpA family protein disulfide reductase [Chitinophagaceae bacterium]|jgi:thiol-disulfide isomerase/thioredoxin|nr:TlpA family protein disulfide reductase [Chitinophagaceae bacterium]